MYDASANAYVGVFFAENRVIKVQKLLVVTGVYTHSLVR